MQFIIQTNLISHKDVQRIIQALVDLRALYHTVKVIPFNYTYLENEPHDLSGPVVAFGSTTMQKIARNRMWSPGIWSNTDFSYIVYAEKFGDEFLNTDIELCRFQDVPQFQGEKFIRPDRDSKIFAGVVIDGEKFEEWQDQVIAMNVDLFPQTPVVLSSPKNIQKEYRFFIVDGKVITGSKYYAHCRLSEKELGEKEQEVVEYAQYTTQIWQPDRAYVIDIAMVAGEYKVLEVNCFNSSGFYKSDVKKIFKAVMEMDY